MSDQVMPICGIACPVSAWEMATAGIRNAKIRTAYCITCVQVIPFMPPKTAKNPTINIPTTTPAAMGISKNRLKTTPTPRICPAT